MDQIRMDGRGRALQARHRAHRRARLAEMTEPLSVAPGGGADVDEELLARIDQVLAAAPIGQDSTD